MKVRFLKPASLELNEALKYYDHQLPGLGYRLFQEISKSINRIISMPDAWTKVGKSTRRCLIKGFPYSLLFSTTETEIIILALANLHRNPEHYKNRIK